MKKKTQHYTLLKSAVLGFQLSFIICFFLGIFWHYPHLVQEFTQTRWYYLNRGGPLLWSGISMLNRSVPFPIVTMPFLTIHFDGIEHVKIIDLRIFLPFFLILFGLFSFISYKIILLLEKRDKVLIKIYVVLTILCLLVYFFWFPRI